MPDYGLQKKEQTEPQPRPSAELTPEQITKSISEILFQRMTESEVELMKAENAELKLTLANFTKNYNKFEDLTNNLIRQNSGELLKLINELHSRQEQKLNALKASNDEVNRSITVTVKEMKSDIQKEVTTIYDKIQNDTANKLKKYNESINTLEKKSRRFWAIEGIKEALFWCMCLAILVFIGRATFDVYGVEFPNLVANIISGFIYAAYSLFYP